MAPTQGSTSSKKAPGTFKKLPPIPAGAKVQKRPLTRRQPPASSKSRIIYVSSSTPFMSAVKRARKQLQDSARSQAAAPKNASVRARVEALARSEASSGDGAVVQVMGTGRAVEKVLSVASWFEQQGDCSVEVRTKTVATVDDVVVEDGDVEDVSRLRKMSCLELSIRLR